MNATTASKLAQWRSVVRQRRALIACACAAPIALGVLALAARIGKPRAGLSQAEADLESIRQMCALPSGS